ncbi:MAG: phospholipase D-like domain-containing protein [Gilvibacter sp.]
MFRAHFTSTSPVPLSDVVIDFLEQAKEWSKQGPVAIDIMLFSFTSQDIYDSLLALSKIRNVQIRILADWGNISKDNERKTAVLADLRTPKIKVKYKFDQPYNWDLERDRLQWSYHASLGLLHHKTIQISLNGIPKKLLTGSFNWTKKGVHNYENILEIENKDQASNDVISAFAYEFKALWNHPDLSLNPAQARMHFAQVKQFYQIDKQRTALQFLDSLKSGQSLNDERIPPADRETKITDLYVAFSGSHPFKNWRNMGFAARNAWRYFDMTKASGLKKRVPLGLSTVALDVIFSADETSELCLCMYAISQRVPEYGALLNAARKGISVRMILDLEANEQIIGVIKEKIAQEDLPIQIRAGVRGMHQKYLLDTANGNLVTGTANMSTDASDRHAEHRFLFRKNKEVVEQFRKDFETIWDRLAPK